MKRGLAFGDLKVVLDDAETKGLGEDRVRDDLTTTLGHGDKLCVYGNYPERQLLEYCECLDGVDYINVHTAVCHAMGMDPSGHHRNYSCKAPCPIASSGEMMEQLRNGVYAEVVKDWNVTSYPHVAARSRLKKRDDVDDPSPAPPSPAREDVRGPRKRRDADDDATGRLAPITFTTHTSIKKTDLVLAVRGVYRWVVSRRLVTGRPGRGGAPSRARVVARV